MMKKEILVAGSEGNIGRCVQWALDRLGVSYIPYDINHLTVQFTEPDFVNTRAAISCLPYHKNLQFAKECIGRNMRYCDLGGRVDVSGEINKLKGQVFTDLGLAPGWINIVGSHLVRANMDKEPTELYMMVGGIPMRPDKCGPLKYQRTWSLDGLLNEYRDDCVILENGELKTVPGMSGYNDGGPIESFFTSGGASHSIQEMKELGLKYCGYKTLRWKGHHAIMTWLMESLSDKEIERLIPLESNPKDIVIMQANVDTNNINTINWGKDITCNEQFTAMQMATAFPLVAAAVLMDEMPYRPLTYADVPYEKFDKIVSDLLDKSGQSSRIAAAKEKCDGN
jgi:saccharopine dehydrogenase-like NADP-dependent oxidoreductase